MIRRTFLKSLMVGAGASMLDPGARGAGGETRRRPAERHRSGKVIIGGAGITGLCCGYELMRAGFEVTILEAAGRYGGHVYTGRDGLSDGLYADFGADHITRPGYERLLEYAEEFGIALVPYPNAEGAWLPYNDHDLRIVGGKPYTNRMLADPVTLAGLGFNRREIRFLARRPWYELQSLYLQPFVKKMPDPHHPFGIGLDELDGVPVKELYRRQGASAAAIAWLGGEDSSALFCIWRLAAKRSRGIPPSEGQMLRLRGGNEQLPNAFARRLGPRVRLAHRITAIHHSDAGVTVSYREYGYDEVRTLDADYFVNCISLAIFSAIPVQPPLSPQKQYVVDNLTYTSHPFYVFEASSRFWLADGFKSINMQFDHPDISSIWEVPSEIESTRVVLKAFAPGGLSPQRVLAGFRQVCPGKRDTIVQGLTKDWTQDVLAPSCEMLPFPLGQMHRFWPQILAPEGRIYFAGTYADLLSRGMESCIRSAQRVAREIVRAHT
jgi:monoamine oxidase